MLGPYCKGCFWGQNHFWMLKQKQGFSKCNAAAGRHGCQPRGFHTASWLPCAQATFEEGAGGAEVELALLLSAEDQRCLGSVSWIWCWKLCVGVQVNKMPALWGLAAVSCWSLGSFAPVSWPYTFVDVWLDWHKAFCVGWSLQVLACRCQGRSNYVTRHLSMV